MKLLNYIGTFFALAVLGIAYIVASIGEKIERCLGTEKQK